MKRLVPITLTLLFILLMLGVTLAVAQDPPVVFPNDPEQTPIDGGLIWLLIGGGVYGIKKLKDRNKSITEH